MASIRKRGNRWQARVTRQDHPDLAKTFSTKADAEKWARGIERAMETGTYTADDKSLAATFATVLARYRREVTPLKPSASQEMVSLAALERTELAALPLASLTVTALAAYRDARLKVVCGSTVQRDLTTISTVLNHARKEWSLAVVNNVPNIRRPASNQGRDRILTEDEEARLLAALVSTGRGEDGTYGPGTRNPWVLPVVILAIETAMRRGELLALTRGHIDLNKRLAYVQMSKNGERRIVPLSTRAVETLKKMPAVLKGPIFPLSGMALRKAFERACKAAGILDFHFHDLRHTATTRLAKRLPNVIELAAVTGHKDLKMLQRYYHPDPEMLAAKIA